MPALFAGVYAPSTLGLVPAQLFSWPCLQPQSAGREVLVELARRTPLLAGADQLCFVDVDSVLRRMYGRAKQGVAFGHTKVGGYPVLLRGYHPLVATVSTSQAAPVVAATRLRDGNAGSARGAASLAALAIGVGKDCGATGQIIVVSPESGQAGRVGGCAFP